jgi:hypothetical protein
VTQTLITFLEQPLHRTTDLTSSDIPLAPGVYAWYRRGALFYVGETRRGLRSRLWSNHLRGNARGSTLRNKVAKAFAFEPVGFRKYGPEAETAVAKKLLECEIRFLVLPSELIGVAQSDLIRELDPPMNDHPGQVPRWRSDEVRAILGIASSSTTVAKPTTKEKVAVAGSGAESQRVTSTDIRAGRIRFPRAAKRYFPQERSDVEVVVRGVRLQARYDPRTGPDKERSAVLLVGRESLENLIRPDEVLSLSPREGIVHLD